VLRLYPGWSLKPVLTALRLTPTEVLRPQFVMPLRRYIGELDADCEKLQALDGDRSIFMCVVVMDVNVRLSRSGDELLSLWWCLDDTEVWVRSIRAASDVIFVLKVQEISC
jgi:hypothetical protein